MAVQDQNVENQRKRRLKNSLNLDEQDRNFLKEDKNFLKYPEILRK